MKRNLEEPNKDHKKVRVQSKPTAAIRRLDLGDNLIGEKGFAAISIAIQYCSMRVINCSGMRLKSMGMFNPSVWTLLEEVDLSGNMFPESEIISLLQNLRACLRLTKFDLSGSHISINGMRELIRLLDRCQMIRYLMLADMWMDDQCLVMLCQKLMGYHELKILDLFGNYFGTNGTYEIMNLIKNRGQDFKVITNLETPCILNVLSLKCCPNLVQLDLSNTYMVGHMTNLCTTIKILPCLAKLFLDGCDIGPNEITYMSQELKNWSSQTIVSLDLNSNYLAEGTVALSAMLMQETFPNLQDLNMSSCDIGSDEMILMAMGLEKLQHLETLQLSGNPIQDWGGNLLSQVIRHHIPVIKDLMVEGCDIGENGLSNIIVTAQNKPLIRTLMLADNPGLTQQIFQLAAQLIGKLESISLSTEDPTSIDLLIQAIPRSQLDQLLLPLSNVSEEQLEQLRQCRPGMEVYRN